MSAGQNGTLRSRQYRNWHLTICICTCTSELHLWSWGAHGRTPFVFPPCLRGLYLSAPSRGGGKEQSAMLCSWSRCCSQYNQSRGAGDAARLLLPQRHSGGCHPRPAARIAAAIRCHTARQGCQQRSGQLENIRPPSLCTTTQSTGFTAPGSCRLSCSPGRSHTNTSTLKEPQGLVEYLGLQLGRQEGVSNIGNAHPIGSGWLHTAPLPSARKESASATLPPHMVTYNTSVILLSLMCLIF